MNMQIIAEIMDLRDIRIRLQRRVSALEDKLFWEPKHFTSDDVISLRFFREEVAYLKVVEAELRQSIMR